MKRYREVTPRHGLIGPVKPVRVPIWFVIVVWEGNEAKIAKKLGVENVYYPKLTRWVRPRRRKRGDPARVPKEYPLLPGFLFYDGDLGGEGGWVYFDKKVRGVLGVGGKPGIVQEAEINRLREAERAGDFDETRELFSGIVGKEFEIVNGGFAGRTAKVEMVSTGFVKLSFAGSRVPVVLPLSKFDEIRQRDELGLPGTRERR